jgi:excisionase family DNA binding protein
MHEITPVAHPVPRAAQLTGLSRSLLYLLMKRRELAFVKVGRRRLITHDDLQLLISRHRVAYDIAVSPRSTPESDRPVVVTLG